MDQRFLVESSVLDTAALRHLFAPIDNLVHVEDPTADAGYRSPEIIALIGLASAGLGAFLKGIFDLASAKGAAKIVLKTSDGTTLEAPATITDQRLAQLVTHLKDLDVKRVQIH